MALTGMRVSCLRSMRLHCRAELLSGNLSATTRVPKQTRVTIAVDRGGGGIGSEGGGGGAGGGGAAGAGGGAGRLRGTAGAPTAGTAAPPEEAAPEAAAEAPPAGTAAPPEEEEAAAEAAGAPAPGGDMPPALLMSVSASGCQLGSWLASHCFFSNFLYMYSLLSWSMRPHFTPQNLLSTFATS